jgi:hypothetical protein
MKILIRAILLFSIMQLSGCIHYRDYNRYGYDDYSDNYMHEESSLFTEDYRHESESGHSDYEISPKPSKHEKPQAYMPLQHNIQHSEKNKVQKPSKHKKRY